MITDNQPLPPISHTPIFARQTNLKVLGLGGGGCNAVNRMLELGIKGVDFIGANTDYQVLRNCLAPTKILLGPKLTHGQGAGGDPQVGEAAAEESIEEIKAALAGADMVFLTAGMGGGTGTGSIPVAARIARSMDIVSVAVVSMPFGFEAGRRQQNARSGLSKLQQNTDTLIAIPNDRLLQIAPRDLSLDLAFRLADDILRQGIQGISEIVTQPGLINVDFSHIRNLMHNGGGSLLAIGHGQGPNKAIQAVQQALHHPLLDSIPIENATGIIANISGGQYLTFMEVSEALTYLQEKTNNQAEIIPGIIHDDNMEDRAEVILIITGLGATAFDPMPRMRVTRNTEQRTEQRAQPSMTVEEAIHKHERTVAYTPDTSYSDSEMAGATINLDIPAFMRRRNTR